jgi:cytoskeletal protein CcmA (bactofilin family)
MATYVNDLRLTEIATGDETGDWGDITNTNLELVAEAFSFGTEAITTNADTHTTTIADGATDPGRSIFLKYTGTLDSACTITIGPNTVSKLWLIENGTSGSQNIIISSGSGANITIPPGDTKAVYSDGAGSGAAMVDAFASLSVVDLKVQDDLTVTDDLIVNGDIDLEGSIDVNGTANLDVVDIDGAVNMATTALVTGVLTTTATQVATGGITSGSNIVSDTDSTDDLGTTSVRWANLFVDGITATDQITATGFTGTLDGILGSGSAAAATVTTLDTSGAVNLNLVTDSTSSTSGALIVDGGVGIAKKLYVGTDLDVDGTANLDIVDIDGAVDMATTLTVGGVVTANAGVVVDSITIDGTEVDSSGDLTLDAVGALRLKGSPVFIMGSGNSSTLASFSQGGAAVLNYNNSGKISTINTGVEVTGGVTVKNGATSAGFVEFFEDSDNGTNKVTLIGPASTADVTLTLPASAGTIATTASAADDATALAIALG